MFGNRDDARDAAQEAFIQAYLKLASFDPQKSFKSWLFAIAMHRSIDLLRRRSSFRRFIAGLHPSAREAAAVPSPMSRPRRSAGICFPGSASGKGRCCCS